MSQIAVITGAGSGVGQAVALALAARDWKVAIVGRRRETLEDTLDKADDLEKRLTPYVCDIGSATEVQTVRDQILRDLGGVEVLVNAAGTNTPKRSLEVLALEDYQRLMDTNLNGAYYCVQAFLPGMRSRRSGTIVNIVSDAGKAASPKAGPAYVMSKFGMAGLTQAINAEERNNGVRACAIFPGDIDTPLLDKRPAPPPREAREKMLRPEDIARCVLLAIDLPSRAVIEEILVRPR
jgi:NAD(P)-dependent dehydrogenase (short-subunit alcohol dehydrogenase family)